MRAEANRARPQELPSREEDETEEHEAMPRFLLTTVPLVHDSEALRVGERHVVWDGVRFEVHGDEGRIAEENYAFKLDSLELVGSRWISVDNTGGRILQSDTFLGRLESVAEIPPGVDLKIAPSRQPIAFVGSDRRLYTKPLNGPLQAVASLESFGVVEAYFPSETTGYILDVSGITYKTDDAMVSWRPCFADEFRSISHEFSSRSRYRSLDRDLLEKVHAQLLIRYPLLAHVLSEQRSAWQYLPIPEGWLKSEEGDYYFRYRGIEPEYHTHPRIFRRDGSVEIIPPPNCSWKRNSAQPCRNGYYLLNHHSQWEKVMPMPENAVFIEQPLRSPDRTKALLYRGCSGEEDHLCWLDFVTGERRTFIDDDDFQVEESSYVANMELLVRRGRRGEFDFFDLSSGESRIFSVLSDEELRQMEELRRAGDELEVLRALETQFRFRKVLSDGNVLATRTLEVNGTEIAARILSKEGRRLDLNLPTRTRAISMNDSRWGVAQDTDGSYSLYR